MILLLFPPRISAESKSLVAAGSIGALTVLNIGQHPGGKKQATEAFSRRQVGLACVVVLDTLCRREWVKDEKLAHDLRLAHRLVRKALKVLKADHFVRIEIVRKKTLSDKELDKNIDDIDKMRESAKGVQAEVGWCCIDFPRAMDALKLKISRMRETLLDQLKDEHLGKALQCSNCGEQYSTLEASKLIMSDAPFLLDMEAGGAAGVAPDEVTSGLLYFPVRNHLEWPQIAGCLVVEEGKAFLRPLMRGLDVFKELNAHRKSSRMSEAMDVVCLRLGKKVKDALEHEDLVQIMLELIGREKLCDSDMSFFEAVIDSDLSYNAVSRHAFAERVVEVVLLQKAVRSAHCAKLRDLRLRARSIVPSNVAAEAAERMKQLFAEASANTQGTVDYTGARQLLVRAMPKVPADEQRAFLVHLRETRNVKPKSETRTLEDRRSSISLKDILLTLHLLVVDIVGGRHISRPPLPAQLQGLDPWTLHYVEGVDDSEHFYCSQCNGIVDYSDEQDAALTGDLNEESLEERRERYAGVLRRMNEQLDPLYGQLAALGECGPIPDYGSLQQWREAKLLEAYMAKEAMQKMQAGDAGAFDTTPQAMLYEQRTQDGVAVVLEEEEEADDRGTSVGDAAVASAAEAAPKSFEREVAPWERRNQGNGGMADVRKNGDSFNEDGRQEDGPGASKKARFDIGGVAGQSIVWEDELDGKNPKSFVLSRTKPAADQDDGVEVKENGQANGSGNKVAADDDEEFEWE